MDGKKVCGREQQPTHGVSSSQCVIIINKALKSEHIKAYRGHAIIHESNIL